MVEGRVQRGRKEGVAKRKRWCVVCVVCGVGWMCRCGEEEGRKPQEAVWWREEKGPGP